MDKIHLLTCEEWRQFARHIDRALLWSATIQGSSWWGTIHSWALNPRNGGPTLPTPNSRHHEPEREVRNHKDLVEARKLLGRSDTFTDAYYYLRDLERKYETLQPCSEAAPSVQRRPTKSSSLLLVLP